MKTGRKKNACPPLERAFRIMIVSSCISLGSTRQSFSPLTLFEGESPGEWGVVGILNSTKRVNELNETLTQSSPSSSLTL